MDTLFCNGDRHLNNIAVLQEDGVDSGAGLLCNTQLSRMNIETAVLMPSSMQCPSEYLYPPVRCLPQSPRTAALDPVIDTRGDSEGAFSHIGILSGQGPRRHLRPDLGVHFDEIEHKIAANSKSLSYNYNRNLFQLLSYMDKSKYSVILH